MRGTSRGASAPKPPKRKLLLPGVYEGRILAAQKRIKKPRSDKRRLQTTAAQATLVLIVRVADGEGFHQEIIDYPTNSRLNADRLRSAYIACGLLPELPDGTEVDARSFVGKDVRLSISVRRGRRGSPERNRIDTYSPPAAKQFDCPDCRRTRFNPYEFTWPGDALVIGLGAMVVHCSCGDGCIELITAAAAGAGPSCCITRKITGIPMAGPPGRERRHAAPASDHADDDPLAAENSSAAMKGISLPAVSAEELSCSES